MNTSYKLIIELLTLVRKNQDLNPLLMQDDSYAFALLDCIKNGYVTGIKYAENANHVPVFQILDNYGITQRGLNLLSNS